MGFDVRSKRMDLIARVARNRLVMKNSSDAIMTRSGGMLRVRPARADDEAAQAKFFKHVTPEAMRFRFLTAVKEVGHEHEMGFTATTYPGDATPMLVQRTLGTD